MTSGAAQPAGLSGAIEPAEPSGVSRPNTRSGAAPPTTPAKKRKAGSAAGADATPEYRIPLTHPKKLSDVPDRARRGTTKRAPLGPNCAIENVPPARAVELCHIVPRHISTLDPVASDTRLR